VRILNSFDARRSVLYLHRVYPNIWGVGYVVTGVQANEAMIRPLEVRFGMIYQCKSTYCWKRYANGRKHWYRNIQTQIYPLYLLWFIKHPYTMPTIGPSLALPHCSIVIIPWPVNTCSLSEFMHVLSGNKTNCVQRYWRKINVMYGV
jgi:hypothetical protein